MSEEELKPYLQYHDDRIALVNFCKRLGKVLQNTIKQPLVEEFRQKLLIKKGNNEDSSDDDGSPKIKNEIAKKKKGTVNAKKRSRRVDVGWIIRNGASIRQVRMKKGGGTRRLRFDKDTRSFTILQTAKLLFFPDGENSEGNVDDFTFELWDYLHKRIPVQCTVSDMYHALPFGTIRVYLVSKRKSATTDSVDDATNAQTVPAASDLSSSVAPDQEDTCSNTKSSTTVGSPVNADDFTPNETLLYQRVSDVTMPVTDECEYDLTTKIELSPAVGTEDNSASIMMIDDLYGDLDDPEVTFPNLLQDDVSELTFQQGASSPQQDNAVVFGDLLPQRTIEVHQGRVLNDLLVAFKDPQILQYELTFRRKAQSGLVESGEGSGMDRDIFSEFWTDFYEHCTVGCAFKVPFTRHDFQQEEWRAVARIIVKGWRMYGYFPVSIAPVMIEECLHDSHKSNILEVFFNYLPASDSEVLRKACTDFSSVESDEVIDILETHNGGKIPTKENIRALCSEIAIKELLQDTKFIIEVWKPVLSPLLPELGDLLELYDNMIPNNRRVVKLLSLPNASSLGQADTMTYLKRFLKEMDQEMLRNFIRFCTGSDLLLNHVKKIVVDFVHMEGLSRRPIAHTCGCVLKLSDNFENYAEFRSEFNSVLRSGVWVMEIV